MLKSTLAFVASLAACGFCIAQTAPAQVPAASGATPAKRASAMCLEDICLFDGIGRYSGSQFEANTYGAASPSTFEAKKAATLVCRRDVFTVQMKLPNERVAYVDFRAVPFQKSQANIYVVSSITIEVPGNFTEAQVASVHREQAAKHPGMAEAITSIPTGRMSMGRFSTNIDVTATTDLRARSMRVGWSATLDASDAHLARQPGCNTPTPKL